VVSIRDSGSKQCKEPAEQSLWHEIASNSDGVIKSRSVGDKMTRPGDRPRRASRGKDTQFNAAP
jgi:hypothetical protein